MLTVIGGANIDISAQLLVSAVDADSTPAHISLSFGGVARNIAHDLAVLGCKVRLITALGNDPFADMLARHCADIGIDITHAHRSDDSLRTGTYICINNTDGDMAHAAADTSIIEQLSPDILKPHIEQINASRAVVLDCNLSQDALAFLLENVRVPIYADGVSTHKAHRIVEALRSSGKGVRTLKLNRAEALAVTDKESVFAAAETLHAWGVEQVIITLGADGVLIYDGVAQTIPAPETEVVNTTGAGDAFLAGAVFAAVQGKSLRSMALAGLEAARQTLQVPTAVNPNLKL